jgi:hypothetical protein
LQPCRPLPATLGYFVPQSVGSPTQFSPSLERAPAASQKKIS